MATLFTRYTNRNQEALAIVSMSVTLSVFLALVLYHALHLCGFRPGEIRRKITAAIRQHRQYELVPVEAEEFSNDEPLMELNDVEGETDNSETVPNQSTTPPVVSTAVCDDQLREPALDDLIPVTPEDYTQNTFSTATMNSQAISFRSQSNYTT